MDESRSDLFHEGLDVRRDVLGRDYVDGSLSAASDFMAPFQELVTEWCWGRIWTRQGLDRRTRSLLNLGMLAALNRPNELRLHVRGALRNGVQPQEIQEVLLQATIYCGVPAGLDAFKVADAVLREAAAEGADGAS